MYSETDPNDYDTSHGPFQVTTFVMGNNGRLAKVRAVVCVDADAAIKAARAMVKGALVASVTDRTGCEVFSTTLVE